MIVIRILGTDTETTEAQMQKITRELMLLCRERCNDNVYVEFPKDRMKMDLGTEIIAQIFHQTANIPTGVGELLRKYFPPPIKLAVQAIEAHTIKELG